MNRRIYTFESYITSDKFKPAQNSCIGCGCDIYKCGCGCEDCKSKQKKKEAEKNTNDKEDYTNEG